MKVLVCGGRDYDNRDSLYEVLNAFHSVGPISVVVHGDAKGADRMAGDWARTRGILEDPHPANWATHGRAAGPIRNAEMLTSTAPDLVIAFPGGRGTEHMVRIAKQAGFRVISTGQP